MLATVDAVAAAAATVNEVIKKLPANHLSCALELQLRLDLKVVVAIVLLFLMASGFPEIATVASTFYSYLFVPCNEVVLNSWLSIQFNLNYHRQLHKSLALLRRRRRRRRLKATNSLCHAFNDMLATFFK